MDYPFTKCLHPQRVINPYTHEVLYVPCGHCVACSTSKANLYTKLCSIEEAQARYTMFVTLTYSNEYVPLAGVSSSCKTGLYYLTNECERFSEKFGYYFGNMGEFSYNHDINEFLDRINLNGYLPYLCVRDAQLFLKRFRKNLSKFTDEKIRYYMVGEYGPRTFRPHWHVLFYFDDAVTLSHFRQTLYKSWKYGRIDYSLSRGKCSCYVASYVNSSMSLPSIYANSAVKPVTLHSTYFGYKVFKEKREVIYSLSARDFVRFGFQFANRVSELSAWRNLTSYFYPKCKGYSTLTSCQRLDTYSIICKARSLYNKELTAKGEKICVSNIARLIMRDLSSSYVTFPPCKDSFLTGLSYLLGISYRLVPFNSSCYDKFLSRLMSVLYVSQHFINFVCNCDDSYQARLQGLHKIEKFYADCDLANLSDFYFTQCRFADSDLNSYRKYWTYFYDNMTSDYDLFQSDFFQQFRSSCINESNKRIKHKVLNDLNKIFL